MSHESDKGYEVNQGYDMKRLKQAVDRQIPPVRFDAARLMESGAGRIRRDSLRRMRRNGLLSAAAVLAALTLAFVFLLPKQPNADRVDETLSKGNSAPVESIQPEATASPLPVLLSETVEDMSLYQSWYSPLWSEAAFPDEAQFDHVFIRKQSDRSMTFEEADGTAALPGRWRQAFAYFPNSGVGLVGNGEAMALLGPDGLITGFVYESLEYAGNRLAFVGMKEGCEDYAPGLSLICIVDGSRMSDEYYDEVGYTGGDTIELILGVRRKTTGSGTDEPPDDGILYVDVMDSTGRFILRCHEVCGVYEDALAVRMEENDEILLVDMNAKPLYGGKTFGTLGSRKNGLLIAFEGGWGVLDETGEWLIEPQVVSSMRFGAENTLIVRDYEGITREINLRGEDVSSAWLKTRMALRKAAKRLVDWLASFGLPGGLLLPTAAILLAFRLGAAHRRGEFRRTLAREGGWAALIVGLLIISHRANQPAAGRFPTDTDVSGALLLAWTYGLSVVAGLLSLIACNRRVRTPARALIAGAVMLLLPWTLKCLCSDMSVKDWRVLSDIVFTVLPPLALALIKSGRARRYMQWCASPDAHGESSRWIRIVWYALTLAAAACFAAGVYLSGRAA